jgi:hypothetical protein
MGLMDLVGPHKIYVYDESDGDGMDEWASCALSEACFFLGVEIE